MEQVSIHPFDNAVSLQGENGRYTGNTSSHYANMIGPFGGITVATLLHAILRHPECQGEPLSATFNFAAPVADGEFEVVVRNSRTNRSTQHWTMELRQDDTIVMTGTAVLAARRDTYSSTEVDMPTVPKYENLKTMTTAALPNWTKNYIFRVVEGDLTSLTNKDADSFGQSETITWISEASPRPLDFLSLIAICDTFFPRVFIKRKKIVPVGTVSMTVQFHTSSEVLKANGNSPVLGKARASRFNNGFFDQTAEIWSETGELFATTSQVVYFKN